MKSVFLWILFFNQDLLAVKMQPHIQPKVQQGVYWLKQSGALRGGKSGPEKSILDVRLSSDKKNNTEKLVFDWGDKLKKRTESGGYYQIQYRKEDKLLILSFSKTFNTLFENHQLIQKIKNSFNVQNIHMEFDYTEQSMNFYLQLKKDVVLKVFSNEGRRLDTKTAQLVIEIM